jgi:ligand-binding sensor domain-containing protein
VAPDFDTTLVSQYIRSIFQDSKGNLWFGTLGEGIVRYDEKTLTYFSNPDGFNQQHVYLLLMKIKMVIFGLGLTRAFINMMEKHLEIIIKKMD